VRILKARIEDQAGEIARLKAALAVFEHSNERTAGFGNSRLALKARVGSAEAQAERQAATLARLRAELAAVNERLAQQAAHFMDEMRRLGAGTLPVSGQVRRGARDGQRRRLAERATQVPARRPEPVAPAIRPVEAVEAADGLDKAAPANGNGAEDGHAAAAAATIAPQAAAEMPQTATIPGERRKVRLLDRITGMGKG
jgi:hypothetical protein